MAEFNIPGVYSKIDASAAVQAVGANVSVIGIVGKAEKGEVNKPFAPISYQNAVEEFGEDSIIIKLMKIAIRNRAAKFILVRVEETDGVADYDSALAVLALEEAVNIVITDSTDVSVLEKVKEHCEDASLDRKERIAFYGVAKDSTISEAISISTNLNTGRIYMAYPNGLDEEGNEVDGIFTAAALAGQVAGESDPALPMTNVEVRGFFGLKQKLKVSEMNALIEAGIIPLETRSGTIRIVRAVSTYTKGATGAKDITWQELTTVRISDYIFKDLRNRLSNKFSRAKNNKRTRDAIKTEVLNALMEYQGLEYIQNVDGGEISVEVNPTNPSRSDVVFPYHVITPLNVIHLTGHLVI